MLASFVIAIVFYGDLNDEVFFDITWLAGLLVSVALETRAQHEFVDSGRLLKPMVYMSASVTLIKRGGTFKIVLEKELRNRKLEETLTL